MDAFLWVLKVLTRLTHIYTYPTSHINKYMYIYISYIYKHTNKSVINCTYILMEIIELLPSSIFMHKYFVTPENVTSFIEET